jgi:hypothetical protein
MKVMLARCGSGASAWTRMVAVMKRATPSL